MVSDEKNRILNYLECCYSGAKMNDDLEIMCRLSRAIIAFNFDDLERTPTWERMLNYYMGIPNQDKIPAIDKTDMALYLSSSPIPYPIANNVSIGSIVITKSCLDVGFVSKVSGKKPAEILSRKNEYSDDCLLYGGINHVTWYDTGIIMTYEQWKALAIETKDASGFYQYWHNELGV